MVAWRGDVVSGCLHVSASFLPFQLSCHTCLESLDALWLLYTSHQILQSHLTTWYFCLLSNTCPSSAWCDAGARRWYAVPALVPSIPLLFFFLMLSQLWFLVLEPPSFARSSHLCVVVNIPSTLALSKNCCWGLYVVAVYLHLNYVVKISTFTFHLSDLNTGIT